MLLTKSVQEANEKKSEIHSLHRYIQHGDSLSNLRAMLYLWE